MYYIHECDSTDIDTTTMFIQAQVFTDKDTTEQRYNTKVAADFDKMDNIKQNTINTVF